MRKLAIVFACACAGAWLGATHSASASLLRYEPFNYSDVGTVVEGKMTPGGETWIQAYAAPAPTFPKVAAGNLPMPVEMDAAIGNSAEIDGIGNGSGKCIRLPLGRTFDQTADDGTTVYYSFALRIDALTGSNTTTGGFFIGLNNSDVVTTANPTAAGARFQSRIDPTDGTKYNLGIYNNRNAMAASASWSPLQLNVGQTYFVVASYEINAGASNDVSRLWINPVLDGVEPAPSATDLTFAANDINIASIILRQSPAPHLTLDELRVGTSWMSVTVPEPASLALALAACALLLVRSNITRR
jgi:hypothetical protein